METSAALKFSNPHYNISPEKKKLLHNTISPEGALLDWRILTPWEKQHKAICWCHPICSGAIQGVLMSY